MSQDTSSGDNPVPKLWWIMVGGNSLASSPSWNRFLSMTAERNKVSRDAKKEKTGFKEAQKAAKEELERAKKTYKETFAGGVTAWRERSRGAETTANGTGPGTGPDPEQRTEETTTAGQNRPEGDG
ncbi:hypothetical protein CABS01_05518 [Colletotrichum abscissum]|uniref:Uncharacterized protein n=1 Tax=Colletotrichum abscissum TaxID=1671311 RepID=A0A9P9XJ71_9PEZI|nr:uncharacterized protein CABS01_05518 [Colletotrichum abscissum]KAI3554759.1 hypothetical protein CABS02_04934 [Colletotrichum abscissum]KAK1521013.1 hypothetical protein CABS01_05518 [Colletotrichum abscissum]